MRRLRTTLCVAALLAGGTAAAAPAAAPPPAGAASPTGGSGEPVSVTGDNQTRTVDCAGRDVMIKADASTLTLKGCADIVVLGSRDHVSADLLEDSSIEVFGVHDVVRWRAFPGASPMVSDRGRNNTLAPY